VTGMTFGESEASGVTVSAFVVALLDSVALWWTYFDRTEGPASQVINSSANPGLTVLSAYTYSHVPMIAGIVALAAVDELIVAHPGVQGTLASVALTLGGTGLFVAGLALFKWAVLGVLP
jgi:low temperature requirement protein LtrA